MQYNELLSEEYLPAIFYFCLKKTGNVQEAEDLSADICLEILSALKRTGAPTHFSAWVWKITRNHFSKWVRRRRTVLERFSDCEDLSEEYPGNVNVEQDVILSEQLCLLRRELSVIRREYREVLVAHYLENQSVSKIAQRLSVPIGTVKTRLQNGRQKLKEGMNMTREFGVRSYRPEDIDIVYTAGNDRQNHVAQLISRMLPKNILLETYRNPSTIEQLSMELGVSSAYMEEEAGLLEAGELLIRENGKYQTNFCIISREAQADICEWIYRDIGEITDRLIEYLNARCAYFEQNHIRWHYSFKPLDDLRWTMLLHTVDGLWEEALKKLNLMPDEQYPLHADGSDWIITGYERYRGKRPPFVGLEGCVSEETGDYSTQVIVKKYELPFGEESVMPMIDERLALALQKVVLEGTASACDPSDLHILEEYCYVKDGKPVVPVFTRAFEQPDTDSVLCTIRETVLDKICDLLRDRCTRILADCPAHLRDSVQIKNALRGFILRGAVVEEAVKNGYLTNAASACGVYMCV